jgi:hypothetical protein
LFLEGLADRAQAAVDEATGGEEQTGISAIKSVTFQQANVLISEISTIREVVTQILDEMRGITPRSGRPRDLPPLDDFRDDIIDSIVNSSNKITNEISLLRDDFERYSDDVVTRFQNLPLILLHSCALRQDHLAEFLEALLILSRRLIRMTAARTNY